MGAYRLTTDYKLPSIKGSNARLTLYNHKSSLYNLIDSVTASPY